MGFALGVDRTLLACDAEGVFGSPDATMNVWVVSTSDGLEALSITNELRRSGLRADRSFDGRSMRAQMKAANRSDAQVAVIVGEDEAANQTVTIRPLRTDGGQVTVPRAQLVPAVKELLPS